MLLWSIATQIIGSKIGCMHTPLWTWVAAQRAQSRMMRGINTRHPRITGDFIVNLLLSTSPQLHLPSIMSASPTKENVRAQAKIRYQAQSEPIVKFYTGTSNGQHMAWWKVLHTVPQLQYSSGYHSTPAAAEAEANKAAYDALSGAVSHS